MRKPLSPALCVLLTTCNHDPEAYIPHREMAGLSGLSQCVCVCVCVCVKAMLKPLLELQTPMT